MNVKAPMAGPLVKMFVSEKHNILKMYMTRKMLIGM